MLGARGDTPTAARMEAAPEHLEELESSPGWEEWIHPLDSHCLQGQDVLCSLVRDNPDHHLALCQSQGPMVRKEETRGKERGKGEGKEDGKGKGKGRGKVKKEKEGGEGRE